MNKLASGRGFWLTLLLSIVTFSIYYWYLIYAFARETNIACKDDNKKTTGLFLFILLSLVTFGIYGIVWFCMWINRCNEFLRKNNKPEGLQVSTFILTLFLLGYLTLGIMYLVVFCKMLYLQNAVNRTYNESLVGTNSNQLETEQNIFNKGLSNNNLLLISVVISGIIILLSLVVPTVMIRGFLMRRSFIQLLISIPIMTGIIGIIANVIGILKMKKLFSLIGGVLFSISTLFSIIKIIPLFSSKFFSPLMTFSSFIPVLIIISAILCFMEFIKNKGETWVN